MLGHNPYLKYFSKEAFQRYITEVDAHLQFSVAELKKSVSSVWGIVFQVGDNPASNTYIRNKIKLCEKFGIDLHHIKLGFHSKNALNTMINVFHAERVPMMVQFPLPWKDITANSFNLGMFDIDGLHRDAIVEPCTAVGILCHLQYVYTCESVGIESNCLTYDTSSIEGKTALIIGRSELVGKPLARMLTQVGMNVIQIHSKTSKRDRELFYGMADVIVCAVGKPNFITLGDADDFMRPDVMIYDVGINRAEDGTLVGDCSPDLIAKGYAVSPVPGGVGLLTTRMFVQNLLTITKRVNGL